ncbi:MAG TPA: antiterminator LoaP [Mobilitalea sp.]|nr:antiterminator LoaP [Mobilitalea sp.]
MWYAVQVRTGEEEKIKLLCNKIISGEILKECFIPYYERMKKYLGEWHKSSEILFPGYIFMVSDYIDELRVWVKKIPNLTKILGDGKDIIPLNDKEIEFLRKFGKEDHSIRMSQGYIENEKIIITDGPMKDFVGTIKKLDRHKRIAVIEMEFFERITEIHIGMEIIRKA